MYIRNKGFNPLIILIVFIIGLSIFFTVINQKKQNNELPVYVDGDELSTESPVENIKDIDMVLIEYPEFTINIPSDWTKVIRNGNDNFIHSPSATSVSINISEYYPEINNIDESIVSTNVANSGYGFVSFMKTSTSSYEAIYQDLDNNTYDYIEEVFWTKDKIVTLTFTVNDTYYNKMADYFNAIYNSFKWNEDQNIIPDDIMLIYIEYGDFEFALPISWSVGIQDNAIYATNSDNTAQVVITVIENPLSLDSVTAYDITNLLQRQRPNGFILQYVSNSVNYLKAAAQYYNNDGINMENRTYLFANGVFLYTVQFDYISNTLDDNYLDTLIEFFKSYYLQNMK